MKHGFLKVIIMLVVISLFMALTGFGSKQKVVLALINHQFFAAGKGDQIFVLTETQVNGAGRAELYLNTVNALKESKLKNAETGATAFRDDYTVINVTEEDGDVVVDFSSRNLEGSPQDEMLLISQIVETLMGSFDEIDSVAFTVDGEEAETLMGHVDITGSFTAPLEIK